MATKKHPTIVTTMRLPEDLLTFADEAAARAGVSRTQYLATLIRLDRTNERIRTSQAATKKAKAAKESGVDLFA